MSDDLMTETEVAKVLRMHLNSLRRLRYEGKGPAYIKIGTRSIRYRPEDVQQYILSKREE